MREAGPVGAGAAGLILVEVAVINARGEQRVALQGCRLAVTVRRDAQCSRPACAGNFQSRVAAQ